MQSVHTMTRRKQKKGPGSLPAFFIRIGAFAYTE
jgi:hypothetical protein